MSVTAPSTFRVYITNNDLREKTVTTQDTSHFVTVFHKEKRVVDLYIILFVHIAEFLESRQGPFDHVRLLAVRNAGISRAAESRPRYEEQVDFLAIFHELHVIAIGRFYEQIESSAGIYTVKSHFTEMIVQCLPVLVIDAEIRSHAHAFQDDMLIEIRHVDNPQGTAGTTDRRIDGFSIFHTFRHQDITGTVSRKRQGLAVRIEDNRIFIELRYIEDGLSLIHI